MSIRDSLISFQIKAECDGCIVYLSGGAIKQNPYEEGTQLWWRFREGWSYAERVFTVPAVSEDDIQFWRSAGNPQGKR